MVLALQVIAGARQMWYHDSSQRKASTGVPISEGSCIKGGCIPSHSHAMRRSVLITRCTAGRQTVRGGPVPADTIKQHLTSFCPWKSHGQARVGPTAMAAGLPNLPLPTAKKISSLHRAITMGPTDQSLPRLRHTSQHKPSNNSAATGE